MIQTPLNLVDVPQKKEKEKENKIALQKPWLLGSTTQMKQTDVLPPVKSKMSVTIDYITYSLIRPPVKLSKVEMVHALGVLEMNGGQDSHPTDFSAKVMFAQCVWCDQWSPMDPPHLFTLSPASSA